MRIGVIGLGMVGEAVAFGLSRIGHNVVGYDTDPKKGATHYSPILDTELAFICVPTPTNQGKCDLSVVTATIQRLSSARYRGLAVIKSTVPPGTTHDLMTQCAGIRLAFCPEFLRERARFSDFVENHELCIAGTFSAYQTRDADLIRKAHGSLPKNFVVMSPTEAELAKYFINCFNAQRVVFANAFYDVCEALGGNYGIINEAVTKRAGITPDYLTCNEKTRAFGGACLPKDTEAFAHFVKSLNLATKVFSTIVSENQRVQSNLTYEVSRSVA